MMRSTWTVLLGLIAATGLGLVAFVAQQEWPHVLDSAIPDPRVKLRLSPGAAVSPARIAPAERSARDRTPKAPPSSPRSGEGRSAGSDVSGSSQVPGPHALSPLPGPAATSNPPVPVAQPPAESPTSATPEASAAPSQPGSAASQKPVASTGADGSSVNGDSDYGKSTSSHGKSTSSHGKSTSSHGKSKGNTLPKPKDADDAKAPPLVPSVPSTSRSDEGEEAAKDSGAAGKHAGKHAGKADKAR